MNTYSRTKFILWCGMEHKIGGKRGHGCSRNGARMKEWVQVWRFLMQGRWN